MVFAALEITLRRRMDNLTRRTVSLEDTTQAIDEAAKWLQGEAGVLKNRTSLAVVANQRQYSVAARVQRPEEIEYWDGNTRHKVESLTPERFREALGTIRRRTIPENYVFLETERVILLNPIPDTAANTTTINVVGGISATATSVTVASTTGFPTEGVLIIDSEVMRYTNTTATTFTGLVRGVENTTAATHANGATVTERDLRIDGQRLYLDLEMRKYYTTGTADVTVGDATVAGTSTAWTNDVAAGDFFGITPDSTGVMPSRWYEVLSLTSATELELTENYAEDTQSGQSYIISSPNPFPNYCDGALLAYSLSILLKKVNNYDRANLEYATAKSLVNSLKMNQLKTDTRLVAGSLRDRGVGQRMPLWISDQRV